MKKLLSILSFLFAGFSAFAMDPVQDSGRVTLNVNNQTYEVFVRKGTYSDLSSLLSRTPWWNGIVAGDPRSVDPRDIIEQYALVYRHFPNPAISYMLDTQIRTPFAAGKSSFFPTSAYGAYESNDDSIGIAGEMITNFTDSVLYGDTEFYWLLIVEEKPTPAVVNVTSTSSSPTYLPAGQQAEIRVVFSRPVNADAATALALNINGVARPLTLISGSGTDTLVFSYTVQPGDNSADLDYLSTGSLTGTITAVDGGAAALLTLFAPGAAGSLGANAAIVVDTTPPVVSTSKIALSGATGTGGVFKIGDVVTATWTADGGDGDAYLSSSLGNVKVDFSAFGGGNAESTTLSGNTWTATYTITSSSSSGTNKNVTFTATDAAGNQTITPGDTNATVDAIAPVVTTANITLSGETGSNNTFKVGDTVTVTWNSSPSGDNNSDVASVSIDFSAFGGDENVVAVNNNGVWTATYVITTGSIDATSANVALTVVDNAGNSSNLTGTNNASVDTVLPTIVDNDIEVTGGTGPSGAFKVGDTVTVEWPGNNTDTIDRAEVNFSEFGGPSNVNATLVNGVWRATYILEPGTLSSDQLQVSLTAYDNANNTLTLTKTARYTANTFVPTAVVSGPTGVVVDRFTVEIDFSEDVVGEIAPNEIKVENGTVVNVTRVSGSLTRFTAQIDPVLGQTVLVQLLANAVTNPGGNPNTASNEYSVLAGSPASEFEKYSAEIRQILVLEAERELRTTLSVNKRINKNARGRMIQADQALQECLKDQEGPSAGTDTKRIEDCHKIHRSVAFDVNGTASMDTMRMQTQGQFFGLQANEQTQSRDIVVGDFSILREKAGSQTATLSTRWVREHDVSERSMLSYFVGADLAASDIKSITFKGDNERVGLSVGVSGLYRIAQGLYLDGFASFGQGRNDLAMANDALALTSQYNTRTTAVGGALSGVLDYQWLQWRPELSWSYGLNKIGEARFTGRAYGLTDNNLRLDAGAVSVSELLFRPEVRVPVAMGAKKTGTLRFSPRLLCEKVKAIVVKDQCGSGGEVGLEILSVNELTKMNFDLVYDRVGNTTRRSLKLEVDHRF
jgi:hypothetical protein